MSIAAVSTLLGATGGLQPLINQALAALTGAAFSNDPAEIIAARDLVNELAAELAAARVVTAELDDQLNLASESRDDLVSDIVAANERTKQLMEAARQRRVGGVGGIIPED